MALGAQHCYHEDQGAFTGEVAPPMLARLGVSFVIVGHSERRQFFAQTDEEVAATLRAVIRHAMTPIVCVGEPRRSARTGRPRRASRRRPPPRSRGSRPSRWRALVIAYEPIWAIGTGRTATAEDAQSACAHIRGVVAEVTGAEAADAVRIQYGGSVRPENAADLLGPARRGRGLGRGGQPRGRHLRRHRPGGGRRAVGWSLTPRPSIRGVPLVALPGPEPPRRTPC